MRITRHWTTGTNNVFDTLRCDTVFGDDGTAYAVPADWDAPARDVLLESVFYKAPLPASLTPIHVERLPAWLCPQAADTETLDGISAENRYMYETDIRAVIHRIAGAATYRNWQNKILSSEDAAQAFYDELCHILLHRRAAFDISLWAQAGLDWAYGLSSMPVSPALRTATPLPENQAMAHARLAARQAAATGQDEALVLPAEHIESASFIGFRRDADFDALALSVGRNMIAKALARIMDACDRDDPENGFDPHINPQLFDAVHAAQKAGLGDSAIRTAIAKAKAGEENIYVPDDSADEDATRITPILTLDDDFIESAMTGHDIMLRKNGQPMRRTAAEPLWNDLADAIWLSGAPHVSFTTAHISQNGGLVCNAPASAPAAAIHILRHATADRKTDIDGLIHTANIMTMALDAFAKGPERPVVLGMAGLSCWLMRSGLAYDSTAGRAAAGCLAALITGTALTTSTGMAESAERADNFAPEKKAVLTNIKTMLSRLSGKNLAPACPDAALATTAQDMLARVFVTISEKGLRNLHVTGLETTPDTQALLGAATRDIAPGATLLQFHETDGVYRRTLTPAVPQALKALGYSIAAIEEIYFYMAGRGTLRDAPGVNHAALLKKGLPRMTLSAIENALTTAQHIRYAFNKWVLGTDVCIALGFDKDKLDDPAFDILTALGFNEDEIEQANAWCCGTQTPEGAPHLKPEHLAVFDCSLPQGPKGTRSISPTAQLRMQAIVESCLSGGVSHTIALPAAATIDDVQKLILKGWELGVKTLKIYRDSSALTRTAIPLALDENRPAAAKKIPANTSRRSAGAA